MIPDDQPTYAVHLTRDEMFLVLSALNIVTMCAIVLKKPGLDSLKMAAEVFDRIEKALPPKEETE